VKKKYIFFSVSKNVIIEQNIFKKGVIRKHIKLNKKFITFL